MDIDDRGGLGIGSLQRPPRLPRKEAQYLSITVGAQLLETTKPKHMSMNIGKHGACGIQ